MAINGVVTTNEVLRHSILIVHSFGFRTLFRCCRAILIGERTTFIECAFADWR